MVRVLIVFAFLLQQLFLMTYMHAAVVMSGTRVIFHANAKDQTLQFQNKDKIPFLVQIWLDNNNPNSSPENADAPFMVNPQVFRLNSNSGQTVRLFYTGDGQLPKDRESIFYLNFKQIPAISKENIDKNKLTMVVNSRFKVFYRPKNITEKIENLPQQLSFSLNQDQTGHWLQIDNPTGYYANLTQINLTVNNKKIDIKDVEMIAPKAKKNWKIKQSIPAQANVQLKVTMVNDYGAFHEYNIRQQP